MQGEPSKPLSRRGIKLTPLVLSLPLAALGAVLVYLGLAMLVGWDRPTLDKLVAAQQQEIGLEDPAPSTSPSSETKTDEDEEPLAVV